MRILSLLVTLLIVGWLVYQQLGSKGGEAPAATYREAEQKAEAVQATLDQHASQQAAAIERAGATAASLESREAAMPE